VVAVGCAVAAVAALPDPNRPVASLAAATVAASLAAGVLRWRLPGTLAVVAGTCTVLLAGALDPGGVRPLLVLLDAVLLVLLVTSLAAAEDAREVSPDAAVVLRASWPRRLGPWLAALAAGAAVAATAAEDVVPSVPVVLAGLAAAVTALVVAVAGHRRP
jgi:hypothetical protein